MEPTITKVEQSRRTVRRAIEERTRRYAARSVFRAFDEDRIPIERFPEFLREQYMAARWFQDLIWAMTDIAAGPFAELAKAHRKRDSGHFRWAKKDLASFGLAPFGDDDWFSIEMLPTRIQMARILSMAHDATPEQRMVVLGALESAGAVTLGALNRYVKRNGLASKSSYLGDAHVAVEEGQSEAIVGALGALADQEDGALLATVDLVFDALSTMFDRGGRTYYGDLVAEPVS